jgi:WD40 repeat protein
VAFAPDGRTAFTCGADDRVRAWDPDTGAERHSWAVAPGAEVFGVAVSADGRFVATAGGDRVVGVWDAGTGERLAGYRGHEGRVRGVAFAPDALLSVSLDTTCLRWRLPAAGP